jgi:hypothetical protein
MSEEKTNEDEKDPTKKKMSGGLTTGKQLLKMN